VLRLLGLGKVAAAMAEGAVQALGPPAAAALAVPEEVAAAVAASAAIDGIDSSGPSYLCREWLFPGQHPVPGPGSLAAGEALLRAAEAAGPDDTVLALVCGGGSSLAEVPLPGLGLAEVQRLGEELLRSGAPIEEINCVRAALSRLKGGGLARALRTRGVTRLLCLVLVDVPRGGAGAVSSGPFALPLAGAAAAQEVLRRRRIDPPAAVLQLLQAQALEAAGQAVAAPAPPEHRVLCDLSAPALVAATLLGPGCAREGEVVQGELETFARSLEARLGGPAYAASGELELRVPPGAPPGGRCQHLALRMARALRGRPAALLAAGTDGRDGPTAARGALVDGTTWDRALALGLDPEAALAAGAAAPLLARLGAALPAGPTGAHAGDLVVLLQ
jgi:hydroxypyruvate reductase